MKLVETFLASVPEAHASRTAPSAKLARALDELVEHARSCWPAVDVDRDTFVSYVAQRLDAAPTPEVMSHIHTGDLYLACACAVGDDRAIAAFEAHYASHITAIVSRVKGASTLTEETKQVLRQQLFVATAERRPKIAEYSGRGELLAFLRVVAIRTALGLLRKDKRHAAVADTDELALLPDHGDDPELLYFKQLYRVEFKASFEQALAELDPRQRSLLRYSLVDGLSIDAIAAVYDIHRATAARQVNKARDALVEGTRAALMARLELSQDDVHSIMRLIRSNVDVSARRLLEHDEAV